MGSLQADLIDYDPGLLAEKLELRGRRVMLFGQPGTGKTTLAAGLAMGLAKPGTLVRVIEADPGSPTCVIAMLENRGGELVVHREVRYIRGGQADVDRAYGWGMEWARGRK